MNSLKSLLVITFFFVITLFVQFKGIKPSMKTVTVHAHPNIALIKYWGKRDETLFLPTKNSLSVTLQKLKTTTTISFNWEQKDVILFERKSILPHQKIINFLNLFRKQYNIDKHFIVETHNNFPTAAGLASSASGFAALAKALNELCELNLSKRELSILARRGSGSACRSIDNGFVLWNKGTQPDGSDSYAQQIFTHDHWPELRVLVVIVKKEEKKISSRVGMQRTVETSTFYNQWITESEQRIEPMIKAIKEKDLPTVGKLLEDDWEGMQETMHTTQPKIDYCIPETHAVIQTIRDLRKENIQAYFTTDAGPNVKIFCLDKDVKKVVANIKTISGVLEVIECQIFNNHASPQTEQQSNGWFPAYSLLKPVTIKAPGKLMLAGEWSVLETGNSCIVLPINKHVSVTLKQNQRLALTDPGINIDNEELFFRSDNQKAPEKKYVLTQKTVELVARYLKEKNIPFHNAAITIDTSEMLLDKKQKMGLGSSAALVVALTTALLQFHDQDTTSQQAKHIIFKLACIAHYQAQGNIGSCFDIAASTYQTPLHYKRFDANWLLENLETCPTLEALLEQPWPGLHVEPIDIPSDFILSAGFSNASISTKELILRMRVFKKEHPSRYIQVLAAINTIVLKLLEALKEKNNDAILELLTHNRMLLQELALISNCNLETSELTTIIEAAQRHGAAAKFSGAGGGDCGIAVCFNPQTAQIIQQEWKSAGFHPLEISILNLQDQAFFHTRKKVLHIPFQRHQQVG